MPEKSPSNDEDTPPTLPLIRPKRGVADAGLCEQENLNTDCGEKYTAEELLTLWKLSGVPPFSTNLGRYTAGYLRERADWNERARETLSNFVANVTHVTSTEDLESFLQTLKTSHGGYVYGVPVVEAGATAPFSEQFFRYLVETRSPSHRNRLREGPLPWLFLLQNPHFPPHLLEQVISAPGLSEEERCFALKRTDLPPEVLAQWSTGLTREAQTVAANPSTPPETLLRMSTQLSQFKTAQLSSDHRNIRKEIAILIAQQPSATTEVLQALPKYRTVSAIIRQKTTHTNPPQ